ncbi:acyl-CoA carboxylase subunit epsilon [Mycobacterium sp. 21AC1]|uniref:acyl-CoA carboxylase subunit epsilon n=1 Tax=[Mycobacterium] appelbergii TaxID=2939269 RepID=UPI00293945B8|nr:acyl-CoA carboxylase subunit epsilon [Mycobacterium sp. 21AC1]MDV3126902.1 acyl-CoA carboxylase subunit epsilon [Mycobacterium sp. 21AC1]
MSGANDAAGVSGANVVDADKANANHEAHIKVVKGQPTDAELAALMAVLSTTGGGAAEPARQERNLWGHPVDKLRYAVFSWQRVTLLERTHIRR